MMDSKHAVVSPETSIRQAMLKMNDAPHSGGVAGIAVVLNCDQTVAGVITDGDIRKAFCSEVSLESPVSKIMTVNPIIMEAGIQARDALRTVNREMRARKIQIEKVLVIDQEGCFLDIINTQSLYRALDITQRRIAVHGMGFVGLTLAVVLAEDRVFDVIGIDVNAAVVQNLRQGIPSFHERGLQSLLNQALQENCISFGVELENANADIHIISVGTPVDDNRLARMDQLEHVSRRIGSVLKKGDLIICRSTVPVGTTRGYLLPRLEDISRLKAGKDFHIAFAPERTVEGAALKELRTLPQIVGGLTDHCADMAASLFQKITPTIIRVESLEAAELVKLMNNTYRDLSFSFANEVAFICDDHNIDSFQLIEAANEGYSRSSIPRPSPGVGGACLSKDPYLYGNSNRTHSFSSPRLGLASREINSRGAEYVMWQFEKYLQRQDLHSNRFPVLISGLAFKGWPETSDIRFSTSLELIEQLKKRNLDIRVFDAVVPAEQVRELPVTSVDSMEQGLAGVAAVFFMNDHPMNSKFELFDCLRSMNKPAFFFDGWGLFNRQEVESIDGLTYATLGYMTAEA